MNNDRSNRVAAVIISRDPTIVDERLEDVDPLSGGWTPLTTDAAEIVGEATTAVEVVEWSAKELSPEEASVPR